MKENKHKSALFNELNMLGVRIKSNNIRDSLQMSLRWEEKLTNQYIKGRNMSLGVGGNALQLRKHRESNEAANGLYNVDLSVKDFLKLNVKFEKFTPSVCQKSLLANIMPIPKAPSKLKLCKRMDYDSANSLVKKIKHEEFSKSKLDETDHDINNTIVTTQQSDTRSIVSKNNNSSLINIVMDVSIDKSRTKVSNLTIKRNKSHDVLQCKIDRLASTEKNCNHGENKRFIDHFLTPVNSFMSKSFKYDFSQFEEIIPNVTKFKIKEHKFKARKIPNYLPRIPKKEESK